MKKMFKSTFSKGEEIFSVFCGAGSATYGGFSEWLSQYTSAIWSAVIFAIVGTIVGFLVSKLVQFIWKWCCKFCSSLCKWIYNRWFKNKK